MQAALRAAIVTLLGFLGGCSLAPTYTTPNSPPPAEAYAEAGDWRKAEPLENEARGAWWTMFQDPGLETSSTMRPAPHFPEALPCDNRRPPRRPLRVVGCSGSYRSVQENIRRGSLTT